MISLDYEMLLRLMMVDALETSIGALDPKECIFQ